MENCPDEEPHVTFAPSVTNEVAIIPLEESAPLITPEKPSTNEAPRRRKKPKRKSKKRFPRRSKSHCQSADTERRRRKRQEPDPEWLLNLVSRHSCNITDDMREERKLREERKRKERKRREAQRERAAQSARRAKTLCSLSSSSRQATFCSYRSLSARLSTPSSARRSVQIQDDLSRHTSSMNMLREVMASPNLQREEVAETVISSMEVEQDISENEIDKLLRELRYKPKDDEEASSKFAMYEEYAKTVETTRGGLCEFWEECQGSFDKRICAAINRDIVKLDSHQNMGIAWNERVWFAYDMIKQANKNNLSMISLLKTIQTKLELVARQDDCPICLEGKPDMTTLTCCHKVCVDCWDEWQVLQGRNAFCPLCKEKDFIQAVLAAEEHPLYAARRQAQQQPLDEPEEFEFVLPGAAPLQLPEFPTVEIIPPRDLFQPEEMVLTESVVSIEAPKEAPEEVPIIQITPPQSFFVEHAPVGGFVDGAVSPPDDIILPDSLVEAPEEITLTLDD